MMDTKEIVHLAVQMEKLAADRSFVDIQTLLGDLDKSHITAEQLETTDLVKVLYGILKTCSDTNVRKGVKSLLSRWRKQYSCERTGGTHSDERNDPAGSSAQEDGDGGVRAPEQQADRPLQGTSASSDSVRTKCVHLLLAALHPEPPDQLKAEQLAEDIEKHIHDLHKTSRLKYKTCVRSKVANLRNPKSPHLCQGLLSGSLLPQDFVKMSVEDMASPELRQLREEFSSQGVSERQLPQGVEGTPTQKIHCKRCGGSDCRVTQVSRGTLFLPAWVRQGGIDQDAMTFVTCRGCGQQWYHSGWVCF
uniref:Transcription elongation factor A (SII) N-terminal and central domain containing n=1 Tax=Nothobranchius korthausae TaxID=1143690 RepID=A0A1A8G3L0_9TELE